MGYFPDTSQVVGKTFHQLLFSSPVSSNDDTIPDLVATDIAGNKIFIVENKFWAKLTPNQPVGYLPLLSKQAPSALF